MTTQDKKYQMLIKEIRDLAHETGYYQAILERCELSEDGYLEYTELNRKAIQKRSNRHGDLIRCIETEYKERKS